MELSGVDRLLTVARELGVTATGPATVRGRANATTSVRPGDDGIRLSLSSAALGEGVARSEDIRAARSGEVTRSEPAAPREAAASDLRRADGRAPAPGSALDAYRRSAGSAAVGERIRIRA